MVRGDKNEAEAGGRTDEGEEIDRIMQEIEDLEKKMDSATEQDQPSQESVTESEPRDLEEEPQGKVVALRPAPVESLAETDAVPAVDEPLMKSGTSNAGEGSLALKVGGCAGITLEFARAGVSVTLSCDDEALVITTDQGAEFKIPFKRAA